MDNVLFIVGSYFPRFSAVGKCQYYLANEFVKRGFNVHVISITSDSEIEKDEIYNGQTIHRILIKQRNKIETVFYRGMKRLSFDILDRELVYKYIKELKRIQFNPDLIVPACLPFESVYASALYKNDNSECKIIPCLYDKFADSKVLYKWKIEKIVKYRKSAKIEKTIFNQCDGLLYVNSWKDYLSLYYKGCDYKMECIEHPLITPPYDVDMDHHCHRDYQVNDNIRILYAGMLTQKYVDAKYLIQCISLFKSTKNMEFIFYAQGNASSDLDVKYLPIKNYGWAAYDELVESMCQASILLSISEQNGVQISSKIFEYMSMGKPIIHIYYVDNDVNLSYLKEYPLCLCIKADVANIESNAMILEKWINKNQGRNIDFISVEELYSKLTPRYVCDQLLELYQKN